MMMMVWNAIVDLDIPSNNTLVFVSDEEHDDYNVNGKGQDDISF